MPGNWLPITDYSTKHKISVSTLRRRIKADDIKYRFLEGKYLLLDEPVTTHSLHRPSLSDSFVNESTMTPPRQALGHQTNHGYASVANHASSPMQQQTGPTVNQPAAPGSPQASTALKNQTPTSDGNFDGPILSAANRLLTELKKAYSQILQEKEEQILQLREEVTDLKTLVRVLEGENDKLNSRLGPQKNMQPRGLDI
jgi:hypothetical protein